MLSYCFIDFIQTNERFYTDCCSGSFEILLTRITRSTTARNYYFLDIIASVLQETHARSTLPKLEEDMNVALALLERDFPVSTQVSDATKLM